MPYSLVGAFLRCFGAASRQCDDAGVYKKAVEEGLPTYAECGGYMYLSQAIVDFEGQSYPMVGLIPAKSQMEKKLQRVGYVTATALRDTLLAPKGTALKGHEFHFQLCIGSPVWLVMA